MTSPAAPSPTPPASGGGMPKWLIIVLVAGLVVVVGCCGGIGTCVVVARRAARRVQSEIAGLRQVQASLPPDVMVMPGFTSSGVNVADAAKGTGMVILNGKGTRADVVAYYEKQMKVAGWSEANNVEMGGGATMVFSKDTRQVTIQAVENNGTVMVTIQYGPKP